MTPQQEQQVLTYCGEPVEQMSRERLLGVFKEVHQYYEDRIKCQHRHIEILNEMRDER